MNTIFLDDKYISKVDSTVHFALFTYYNPIIFEEAIMDENLAKKNNWELASKGVVRLVTNNQWVTGHLGLILEGGMGKK